MSSENPKTAGATGESVNGDGKGSAAFDQGAGEFRTSGEVGHGYISGVTFTDKVVTFSRIGGQAIFEGDIVLDGRLTVIEEAGQAPPGPAEVVVDLQADDEGRVIESAVVVTGGSHRWPNGIIPLEIDAGLPQVQSAAVQDALAHWRSKTRLGFPQRTQNDPDWMRFVSGDSCSSQVGRQGGRQDITLGAGCGTGQAIHEIGHAVGLWHEQSREDRDSFVTINWQNIDPAQRHNFDQHISDGDDVGEYDYGSIMHYPRDGFSINDKDTITPKQAGATIGQRDGLSAFDTAGVRSIYPGLQSPTALTWVGDFDGDGQHDLLAYVPARMNWWLGTAPNGKLGLRDLGSTNGFGQVGDGRPFWIGRFSRPDRDEILFYFPGDDNWWLGRFDGGNLAWSLVSNTTGFGHAINDGRPFWIGDFNGDGRSEVLVYYPGDDNWWLGQHNGSTLAWSLAGNTLGFGQVWDGRPFWTGRFAQRDRDNVVFYFPGDGKYWIATCNSGQLAWRVLGDF